MATSTIHLKVTSNLTIKQLRETLNETICVLDETQKEYDEFQPTLEKSNTTINRIQSLLDGKNNLSKNDNLKYYTMLNTCKSKHSIMQKTLDDMHNKIIILRNNIKTFNDAIESAIKKQAPNIQTDKKSTSSKKSTRSTKYTKSTKSTTSMKSLVV